MSANPNSGPLSGSRWNAIVDSLVRVNEKTGEPEGWFYDEVDKLIEKFNADGYAPFNQPIQDPYMEYLRLMSLRDMNDPRYTADVNAQTRFAELAAQYGQPGPLALNPLAGQV